MKAERVSCDSWGSSDVPRSTSPTCSLTEAMASREALLEQKGCEGVQLEQPAAQQLGIGVETGGRW